MWLVWSCGLCVGILGAILCYVFINRKIKGVQLTTHVPGTRGDDVKASCASGTGECTAEIFDKGVCKLPHEPNKPLVQQLPKIEPRKKDIPIHTNEPDSKNVAPSDILQSSSPRKLKLQFSVPEKLQTPARSTPKRSVALSSTKTANFRRRTKSSPSIKSLPYKENIRKGPTLRFRKFERKTPFRSRSNSETLRSRTQWSPRQNWRASRKRSHSNMSWRTPKTPGTRSMLYSGIKKMKRPSLSLTRVAKGPQSDDRGFRRRRFSISCETTDNNM